MSGWVSPPPTLHQVRSHLVHWGGGDGGGEVGGENGHPLPQQSGWCFVRRRSPLGVGDEVLSETDSVLAVSELLCHPWGT